MGALVVFFSLTVKAGERVLFLFYVENQLGFNETNVATYVLLHSFGGVLAQSLILNALVQRTGERNVVIIAMLCGGLSSFLYGVARNSTLIYIGSIIFAYAFPVEAANSKRFRENDEGMSKGLLSEHGVL